MDQSRGHWEGAVLPVAVGPCRRMSLVALSPESHQLKVLDVYPRKAAAASMTCRGKVLMEGNQFLVAKMEAATTTSTSNATGLIHHSRDVLFFFLDPAQTNHGF